MGNTAQRREVQGIQGAQHRGLRDLRSQRARRFVQLNDMRPLEVSLELPLSYSQITALQ